MKMKLSFVAVVLMVLLLANKAYSFMWTAHIYINRQAAPTLGSIYETYGIMPDIFNFSPSAFNNFYYTLDSIPYPRVLHSPDNKEEPLNSGDCPYQDKQNFGYLLFKAAESNNQLNVAKGYGGHIAADWVAHKQSEGSS